jgi:MFS transporter, PAT family, beta-lactamase induction signal transducer AmpG
VSAVPDNAHPSPAAAPSLAKLGPLLALYFSQGLPFGFQASALPLLLRERGESLQAIGFASLLAAPWLTKALWAPLVDRYGSARFGRRKSWIVPMQAGLMLCALAAGRTSDPSLLFGLIFAMNLCAATQDIAVDALAVSWLASKELGPGNALQVVGYKLGMLTGGGVLVWASAGLGWSGVFDAMAVLMAGVLVVSLRMSETARGPAMEPDRAPEIEPGPNGGPSFRGLLHILRSVWRQPAAPALIAVVMTYKLGETLANSMWKPMLFDRGFPTASVGLWSGTFGMLFSLLGSSASGLLVRRVPDASALVWIAALRGASVVGQWWVSTLAAPTAAVVIAVTCVEHLFGGAITTVMFALMMRHTDRRIGATHYTLLASLEVWGKLPLGALSGLIATRFGYEALFASGALLCGMFVLLAARLRPRLML